MKRYQRLIRGAHDGHTRPLSREIYDQAAAYGITDASTIESLYSRACDWAWQNYTTPSNVYRSMLEHASGKGPRVAPCKRTRTAALYGDPTRVAAPKPGVGPCKRMRTQTLVEELAKRERYLKLRDLVEECRRMGRPLPNEVRYPGYREVVAIIAETQTQQQLATGKSRASASSLRAKRAFDQVFADITIRPDNAVRTPPIEAGLPVQGKGMNRGSTDTGGKGPPNIGADIDPRGSGEPLPKDVQAKMEAALGMDFSDVRIHTGPQAAILGARAFTRGKNIFFAPGQYQPQTAAGQELLAHELTHVVQQVQGRVGIGEYVGDVAINNDAALEAEANEMGVWAAQEAETPMDTEQQDKTREIWEHELTACPTCGGTVASDGCTSCRATQSQRIPCGIDPGCRLLSSSSSEL